MDNDSIKSINKLIDYHFLVEDYQRGYKWGETEVEQLLNDVNDFNEEGFYCLQPIVVKEIKEEEIKKIELIDGQQRITTIFIILSFLNEKRFKIEYRTRKSSKEFLTKISQIGGFKSWESYLDNNKDKDNIDNFHFFQAFHEIKKWFNDKGDEFKKYFISKLLNHVKVIWYKVPLINEGNSKEESIKIFTRINSGKIPLTNAELIKALFLINIKDRKDSEKLQLKQNEIAQQWDSIEYALQEDTFWYFLCNEKSTATRIDLIFNLIANKPTGTYEKLYTFLNYNGKFSTAANKEGWVEEEWEKVNTTFLILKEWYEDRTLYHLIGFLICCEITSITKLYREYCAKEKKFTKNEFLLDIKNKIKEKVKEYNLNEISYGKNNHEINTILLLLNVQTELNNKDSTSKYQFDRHKQEKWSLEHIHAQKQDNLNGNEKINSYVKEFIEYLKNNNEIKDDPQRVILNFKERNKEIVAEGSDKKIVVGNDKFKLFLNDARQTFPELFDLDALDNMALISGTLNSSLGNGFFDEKRKGIIAFDKKGEFIPICTRNVFLKYYSNISTTNLFYWSTEDRADYLENIKYTLNEYIDYKCPNKEEPKI